MNAAKSGVGLKHFVRLTKNLSKHPMAINDDKRTFTNELKAPKTPVADNSLDHNKLKRKHIIKWVVLLLACLLLFGNYYCYDIPGAINTHLGEYLGLPYEEWQMKMNSLYTAYSVPNLIMPIIGGMLIDSLGATKMLFLFAVVMVAGQLLFTFGISSKFFWVMIAGRALFGIGGESLEVAQARITTDWFAGHYLGLALGLNLTSARFASALNDFVSPVFENPVNAGWFGVGVCVMSLLCGVALNWFSHLYQHHNLNNYHPICLEDGHVLGSAGDLSALEDFSDSDEDNSNDRKLYDGDDTDSSDETRALLNTPKNSATPSPSFKDFAMTEGTEVVVDEHSFKVSDILSLPLSFWLLCIGAMTLYGAVNPFIHILSDFLQKKYFPGDAQRAGALMSIPDLISAVGSPVGGYVIDRLTHKYPRMRRLRSVLIPLAGVLLLFTHYLIGFTAIDPILPLVMLGVAYSIFGAALWPLIPHFVENKRVLGTAYGVSAVALNIALAISPIVVATLLTSGGYFLVSKYFIALSAVSILFGLTVVASDNNNSHAQSSD